MEVQRDGRRIDVAIASDLPDVFVDRDLIQLALRQLVDNALKYSVRETAIQVLRERLEMNLLSRCATRRIHYLNPKSRGFLRSFTAARMCDIRSRGREWDYRSQGRFCKHTVAIFLLNRAMNRGWTSS